MEDWTTGGSRDLNTLTRSWVRSVSGNSIRGSTPPVFYFYEFLYGGPRCEFTPGPPSLAVSDPGCSWDWVLYKESPVDFGSQFVPRE